MIETERLVLREWRDADVEALLRMGQDPRVMEYLGPLEDRARVKSLIDGQMLNQSLFGHCFWPCERRVDGELLGYCGLNPAPANTPLEGGIEIGWRLAYAAWGHGYAHEAASACLEWAWEHLRHAEVVSMTVAANRRSWGLMERLCMARRADLDFEHPALEPNNPLRPHIAYSIARPVWAALTKSFARS